MTLVLSLIERKKGVQVMELYWSIFSMQLVPMGTEAFKNNEKVP